MTNKQAQQLELITNAATAAGYLIRPLFQPGDFEIWMGKDFGRTLRFTLNVKGVPTYVKMDSVYGLDYTNAKARQTLQELVDSYVAKMDHEQIGQMIEDVKAAEEADNGPDPVTELAATLENAPARSAEEIKIFHAAFQAAPANHVATWRSVQPMTDLFDGLEAAFRCTNNINGSWSRDRHIPDDGIMISNGDYRENVEVVGGRRRECGLRSTSVGDAAEVVSYNLKAERIERCYFVCAMDGWEELSEMCFEAYLRAESMRKGMIFTRDDAVRIATGAVV